MIIGHSEIESMMSHRALAGTIGAKKREELEQEAEKAAENFAQAAERAADPLDAHILHRTLNLPSTNYDSHGNSKEQQPQPRMPSGFTLPNLTSSLSALFGRYPVAAAGGLPSLNAGPPAIGVTLQPPTIPSFTNPANRPQPVPPAATTPLKDLIFDLTKRPSTTLTNNRPPISSLPRSSSNNKEGPGTTPIQARRPEASLQRGSRAHPVMLDDDTAALLGPDMESQEFLDSQKEAFERYEKLNRERQKDQQLLSGLSTLATPVRPQGNGANRMGNESRPAVLLHDGEEGDSVNSNSGRSGDEDDDDDDDASSLVDHDFDKVEFPRDNGGEIGEDDGEDLRFDSDDVMQVVDDDND